MRDILAIAMTFVFSAAGLMLTIAASGVGIAAWIASINASETSPDDEEPWGTTL